MANIGKHRTGKRSTQKEWSKKEKSLLTKFTSGVSKKYTNLKHKLQREVSKIATQEERNAITKQIKTGGKIVGTRLSKIADNQSIANKNLERRLKMLG